MVVLGYLLGVLGALCIPISGLGPSVGLLTISCKKPALLVWSRSNLLLFNVFNQPHPKALKKDSINKA